VPQALKEAGRVQEAERALLRVLALDAPNQPTLAALRLLALMRQQQGQHARAIQVLDKALGHGKSELVSALQFAGTGGGAPW
jgi:tetratricopeptide (TPR) repeat protein